MKTSDYKNLSVWQKSMDLAERIYGITEKFPYIEKSCLIIQMNKCAVSIPSNIAEGQARGSRKEFIHFLNISKGSVAELETQIILSARVNLIEEHLKDSLLVDLKEINKMIISLIIYLKTKEES